MPTVQHLTNKDQFHLTPIVITTGSVLWDLFGREADMIYDIPGIAQ